MKKLFSLMLVCCAFAVFANAQDDNEACVNAVPIQYGADIRITGETYWVKLKLSDFQEKGISAFWYSTDSLFLEAYLLTGVFSKKCTPLNLSFMSAPNAKIIIDANELMQRVEDQMAREGGLSESDKAQIRESMVYMGLVPRSQQPGRFIVNEFGIAAGSDCDNPWDVAINAFYGLTPEENIFRLDAAIADSLHVIYTPMRATATDMTLMNVDVRLGSCDGAVIQSGKSVDNAGEGIFIPSKEVLQAAVEANKPLFFTITRGDEPATVSFSNIFVDTILVQKTICLGETLQLYGRSFSEAGEYEFDWREKVANGLLVHHVVLSLAVNEACDDAIEDVYAPVSADKVIENGNVVIRRNGAKYTTTGAKL